MPDGKTHETINAAALIASLAGLYHISSGYGNAVIGSYLDTYTILVFSVAYLFATFFLSPDLDTHSRPYKRWKMFRILWWPYRIIFKHRGFSHNLILGPLSILINLALITIPLLLLVGVELQKIPSGFILAAIVGIVLSMEIHIISDRLISKMRSWF
jgi:uncharacterized metal-binding protein